MSIRLYVTYAVGMCSADSETENRFSTFFCLIWGGGGLQGIDISLKKEDVKVIYKLGLRMWSDNRPLFLWWHHLTKTNRIQFTHSNFAILMEGNSGSEVVVKWHHKENVLILFFWYEIGLARVSNFCLNNPAQIVRDSKASFCPDPASAFVCRISSINLFYLSKVFIT